jgi:LmbE family N-acetylglucosaminyl deacetylase
MPTFSLDLLNTDRLIVVAHPDDEVIFAGAELWNFRHRPNALGVLCVTCGTDGGRAKEFHRLMTHLGHQSQILPFPDRHHGWKEHELAQVRAALIRLDQSYKGTIVSHAADGEYGHAQHVELGQFWMAQRPQYQRFSYFKHPLAAEVVAFKRQLLSFYPSQAHIFTLPLIEDWVVRGGVAHAPACGPTTSHSN